MDFLLDRRQAVHDSIDLGAMAQTALREAFRERGHVNILIAGRSGVGKSTLINAVFEGQMATTGQGRPVTKETREFTKSDIPLSIFDTQGIEMADFSATLESLRELVTKRATDPDARNHIHVAWVCIAEDLRRVEPAEQQLAKMLEKFMPVVAVVTKARSDQGFRTEVQNLLPEVRNVVRVRAIQEEFDDGHISPAMGLKELVDLTNELVPEGQRRAFAAAQKVDVSLKKKHSHLIVVSAATSAAAIGATPIPFADAALILPVQVGMLAGITATFGLSIDTAVLSSLIGSVAGGTGAAMAGRAIVGGLLKLIPGGGTVLGGAISATTAFALTTALGEVYIHTLELLFTKNGGEPPSADEVLETFKKQYTEKSITVKSQALP